MRSLRLVIVFFACVLLDDFASTSRAEDGQIGAGAKLETLIVGATTYHQVQVRSVNARTVMITHAGGMASIHLRDLSPEWQARFHYDPAAEAAADQVAKATPPPPVHTRSAQIESTIARLARQFGQPATLTSEVDLRPKFFELELGVKNQGRRPSCAIFAIVSALEFQNAELTGKPQKFSEEYLSWATRKTVKRVSAGGEAGSEDARPGDDADDGFSLGEVVDALRGYGIPLQSSMPNTFGRTLAAIEAPSPAVIAEARSHQRVSVLGVPGRDNATRINNIIHVLNAGIPVVIGVGWPNFRSLRTGYLSGQKPMPGHGHAVTLVGYLSQTSALEDVVFIFKNSWGAEWAQGGYGTVTFRYLNNNLGDAVVLEVQTG